MYFNQVFGNIQISFVLFVLTSCPQDSMGPPGRVPWWQCRCHPENTWGPYGTCVHKHGWSISDEHTKKKFESRMRLDEKTELCRPTTEHLPIGELWGWMRAIFGHGSVVMSWDSENERVCLHAWRFDTDIQGDVQGLRSCHRGSQHPFRGCIQVVHVANQWHSNRQARPWNLLLLGHHLGVDEVDQHLHQRDWEELAEQNEPRLVRKGWSPA